MTDNPYQAPSNPSLEVGNVGDAVPREVAVRPFSRLSDAVSLLGDQYLLMVGVCFVAIVINSVVPFNLLMGPLACGLHICLSDRARGQPTSFDRLFKGFDHFGQSLVAALLMMVAALTLIMPAVLLMFAGLGILAAARSGNDEFIAMSVAIGLIPFVLLISILSLFIYVPFLFCFSLIVDQRMSAGQAIKTSWEGAWKNFWGIVGMLLLYALIGMACAMACYIPVFFVIPIQLAAIYLVYRDVFADSVAANSAAANSAAANSS